METINELPANVGAIVHPINKHYIMFTTFDGTNVDDRGYPFLEEYKEAIKKLVTVMEYEYFQSIVESIDGEMNQAFRPIFLPQSIQSIDKLPFGFKELILGKCEDFGENTMAILRFFEYDKSVESYQPVDIQFDESGNMVQDEEE